MHKTIPWLQPHRWSLAGIAYWLRGRMNKMYWRRGQYAAGEPWLITWGSEGAVLTQPGGSANSLGSEDRVQQRVATLAMTLGPAEGAPATLYSQIMGPWPHTPRLTPWTQPGIVTGTERLNDTKAIWPSFELSKTMIYGCDFCCRLGSWVNSRARLSSFLTRTWTDQFVSGFNGLATHTIMKK